MNTREFDKKLVSKERLAELISSAKKEAEDKKLQISQEVAEKYKMKTVRVNHNPWKRRYSYKS